MSAATAVAPTAAASASAPTAAGEKPKAKAPSALVARAAAQLQWRSATPIDAVLKKQQQKASGVADAKAAAPTASAAAGTAAAAGAAGAGVSAAPTAGASGNAAAAVWKKETAAAAAAMGSVIGAAADDGSLPPPGTETRTVVFDVYGDARPNHPPLRLLQKQEFGISGWVWPCALVLTKYLIRADVFPPQWWAQQRVLELGSGTGLVGFVAAWQGAAHVTLTDIALNLELLHSNARLNCDDAMLKRVSVVDYLWAAPTDRLLAVLPPAATPAPAADATAAAAANASTTAADAKAAPHYDLIIGSDVVYKPEYLMDLHASLLALTTSKTTILLAYEERFASKEKPFFEAMQRDFHMTKVPSSELDPKYQADDILIFRFQRKAVAGGGATQATA